MPSDKCDMFGYSRFGASYRNAHRKRWEATYLQGLPISLSSMLHPLWGTWLLQLSRVRCCKNHEVFAAADPTDSRQGFLAVLYDTKMCGESKWQPNVRVVY